MGPTVGAMMKAYLANHKMMDVDLLANFADFALRKLKPGGISLSNASEPNNEGFEYVEKLLAKANGIFFQFVQLEDVFE